MRMENVSNIDYASVRLQIIQILKVTEMKVNAELVVNFCAITSFGEGFLASE